MPGCKYEDELFEEEVLRVVAEHNTSDSERPLFLFWAPHIAHTPGQVPEDVFHKFDFIAQHAGPNDHTRHRQVYSARVRYIDAAFGKLTDLVKNRGM